MTRQRRLNMRIKIFSTTLEISFLTVAVTTVVLMLDTSYRFLCCILCAFLHEFGHLVAMIILKVEVSNINIRLFDIVIESKTDRTFKSDLVITLMGPMFNFLFAIVFYFVDVSLCYTNLAFAIFNLLPVDTFDGGYILYLLLYQKCSYETVRIISKLLTFIFLLPIFMFGVMVLFYSRYNYSLLLISLYLVAILFLK